MGAYGSTTEDGKCIFCEIAQGNYHTPGIIWEDANHIAFLSLWPNTEGATVVIPKEHYGSDCFMMPDDKLKDLIIATKKTSNLLLNFFDGAGRIALIQEGTGVDHAHMKLFPMHGTKHFKEGHRKQYLTHKVGYFDKYDSYLVSYGGPRCSDEEISLLASKIRKNKDSTAEDFLIS